MTLAPRAAARRRSLRTTVSLALVSLVTLAGLAAFAAAEFAQRRQAEEAVRRESADLGHAIGVIMEAEGPRVGALLLPLGALIMLGCLAAANYFHRPPKQGIKRNEL